MAQQITDFYENTTKVFSGVITHNGSNPDTTNDTITFIMKAEKSDADASAIINEDATGLGAGGTFTFTLTPAITDDTPAQYWYEIVWHTSGGDIYVLEQGKIYVLDKVEDNV